MKLTTKGAIHHMIEKNGKTRESLSTEMGRHKTYLTTMLLKQKTVNVKTLLEIAGLCGYKLYLRGHGGEEEVTI